MTAGGIGLGELHEARVARLDVDNGARQRQVLQNVGYILLVNGADVVGQQSEGLAFFFRRHWQRNVPEFELGSVFVAKE